MTPMRRSQNWLPYVFNDLFDNDWMIKANSTAPAINVIESDKDYRVEVAAPGMTKNDFNIKIDENNNLVVSMEKKEEKNEDKKDGRYLRRSKAKILICRQTNYPNYIFKIKELIKIILQFRLSFI